MKSLFLGLVLAFSACAATPPTPEAPATPAVEQPLPPRDLYGAGLIGCEADPKNKVICCYYRAIKGVSEENSWKCTYLMCSANRSPWELLVGTCVTKQEEMKKGSI